MYIKINLIELLEKNNKSKAWLSLNTGISRTNINKIANGLTTEIAFETIIKLCLAFNCDISDLITLVKVKEKVVN